MAKNYKLSEEEKEKARKILERTIPKQNNTETEKIGQKENNRESGGYKPTLYGRSGNIKSSLLSEKGVSLSPKEMRTLLGDARERNAIIRRSYKQKASNPLEYTPTDFEALKEAEEINKRIQNGGPDAVLATIENAGRTFAGGVEQGITGIENAFLIPTATMLKNTSNMAKRFGFANKENGLDRAVNSILDVAENKTDRASYSNKINSRIDNDTTKTIGNVTSVIGNMVPAMVSNVVAPGSGLVVTGVSSGGNSAQETINEDRSNLNQATLTGIAKGIIESATEKITGGNILSKGSLDDFVGKTISSKVKSNIGKNIVNKIYQFGGEMLEEQISDNAGYLIDKVVNNKELPEFEEWWNNAGETNKITFLSTLALNLIGLGGSNVENVDAETQQMVNEVAEKANNDPEMQRMIQSTINNINNEQNANNQTENNVLPTARNTNQNIASNQEILYNNNESESGLNEQIQQSGLLESNNGLSRVFEENGNQEARKYSRTEYEQWERTIGGDGKIEDAITDQRGQAENTGVSQRNISEGFKENRQISYEKFIDYANKNKIELDTVETKNLRKIANDLGMNAILFNGDGNSDYIGMTDKQNPNNIYIDINQKEIRGEDILYHEFLHSRKRNNDSVYTDKIFPIEQDIVQNYRDIINNFIEEKGLDEKYKDYPELIAEEIIADYTSKHLGNLEIDYDLPQFYIETINQAVDEMINDAKNNNIQRTPSAKNNVLTTEKDTKQKEINQSNIEINLDLPISENQKFRKHYKSIIQSQYTSDESKTISKELMKSDTYVPESNNKQLERADKRIELSGADSELNSLMSRAMTGGDIKADDIAVGERLIQYYSKIGNKTKLQDAIQATAMAGTTAGQTVQAMSLLNHQTPEGQAVWLQRSVDKMNNDFKKARGEKAQQFNLTENMISKIINSKNSEELQNNLNEVYQELGQQVSKTTMQKIDAWRYFAMLANPRTHIRNIAGNTAMGTMQSIKNKVAGGIEAVVQKINPNIERTHTIAFASKDVKQFAKNDIKNVADRLGLNENKYNPKTRLENSMRTFKHDAMEKTLGKLFDLNDKALEAEDGWGLKAGYTKALSEYMTANKLTPKNITDKQLAKARNYAIEQAQEATFHQTSALATLLNQFSNKNKVTKFIADSILPFKKTPINVAKSGLEYSPIGLVKSVIYDSVELRKGNITVNKYIDNISKGLTGTGIALVGYALANAGILKASGSDDKDKERFEQDRGSQTYSIQIGDNTYSLDWLAPSGIPLFIGTEAYEIMQTSKKEKSSVSSDDDTMYNQAIESAVNILDAFTNAMNPMTEMSMLSGITSAMKSYDGDSSKILANLGINSVKSYINQFIPTALGQVAKTTDKYERSTTSTKTGTLPKAIDTTKNYVMNKIPGLRQMLPIKTDIWGNELKQSDNVLQRALENSIFPWTRKGLTTTKVDKELINVYNNTGESSVLPDSINKNLTIDKQKYVMTSEEYSKYKRIYGTISYNLLNSLVKSNNYKNLSDSQKQYAIEKVYDYATEQIKVDYAKNNKLEYEESKLSKTINTMKDSNAGVSNYFEYLALTEGIKKDSEKIKVLTNSNFSNKSKEFIYENNLLSDTNEKYYIIKDTGLNINSYLKYKLAESNGEFLLDKEYDGTVNGKSISGSKKEKVLNYINSIEGATYTQKLILAGLEYSLSDYEKSQIVNYIDSLDKTEKEKLDILSNFKGFTIYKDGTFDY